MRNNYHFNISKGFIIDSGQESFIMGQTVPRLEPRHVVALHGVVEAGGELVVLHQRVVEVAEPHRVHPHGAPDAHGGVGG